MKKFLFVVVWLLYLSVVKMSADMIQTGEELFYDVTYLNIKLGTIKIITLADTIYQDEKVYHSKVYIQSNPNIPFYSLKSVFNSYMDTSLSEGRYFESNSKEQDFEWGFQKITFRDKRAKSADMKVEKWYDKEKINDSTYYNIGKVIDGSSLFFFARQNSDKTINAKIPTIMDMAVGNTKLKFTGKTEKIKIDAIKYPVNTYYIEGKCEWVALYGLGDKFQGWFSCDDAKIPIKAKMNVYLGSVVIELKNWKRTNWNPPQ